jgi:tetratricopeptide (TPR) repeat protein
MARKLYFHAVVKNKSPIKSMLKTVLYRALVIACLSAVHAGPACATGIFVGGSENVTRIIFNLNDMVAIAPDVSEENQTLIVNFPHTVADPQAFQDQFMIQGLTFDGTKATIAIKTPFAYQVSTRQSPPSVIIDLTAKKEQKALCPIKRIEVIPGKVLLSVSMNIEPDMLPEVRTTKSGRIYLHFPADFPCDTMEKLLAPVPQLKLGHVMKMSSGTVLTLNITEQYTLMKTRTDKDKSRIIFDIRATNASSPETRYLSAKSLFSAGNIAGVITVLEPAAQLLDAKEKILLARSYWALAFPYQTQSSATRALTMMNAAIQKLPDGLDRERIMLEYCSMLISSGMANQASDQVKSLKRSLWDDIKAEAGIREIDILNHNGAYQDAYAANKRLINELGQAGVPAGLKATYLAVLAETYLGLNDYAKAFAIYQEALAADHTLIRQYPGLYAHVGEAAFKMNDFAQAKDYLIQAFNLGDPSGKQKYLLMLGDCLYQIGEKDKALVAFSQVESLASTGENLVIAKLKSARIIIEKNTDEHGKMSDRAFNEVMDIYETLKTMEEYKDKSLSSLVKVRIAQAYAKHGQSDKALDTYIEVWGSTKKIDTIHHYAQVEALRSIIERVRILHRDSKNDQIYTIYTRYQNNFIKELSDSATLFIIGDALNRVGQLDKARAVLESSTREESPYKEQALYLLFVINVKQGRYQEALIWNTLYLTTYPTGKDIGLMKDRRGEVLYLLGSLKESLTYLEASANSDSPLALNSLSYLANAYQRLGLAQLEEQTLERIISYHGKRISPIIEDALYLRAAQLKGLGEFAKAKTFYQILLDTYPKSSHAYWAMYHLSQIAYALGDQTEAKNLLTNVIRLTKDPLLLSAARLASNDIDLQKDLTRFNAGKSQMRRQ